MLKKNQSSLCISRIFRCSTRTTQYYVTNIKKWKDRRTRQNSEVAFWIYPGALSICIHRTLKCQEYISVLGRVCKSVAQKKEEKMWHFFNFLSSMLLYAHNKLRTTATIKVSKGVAYFSYDFFMNLSPKFHEFCSTSNLIYI